jgi:hypothetical protein
MKKTKEYYKKNRTKKKLKEKKTPNPSKDHKYVAIKREKYT